MTISSGVRDRPKIFRLSVRTRDRSGDVAAAVKDLDNLKGSSSRYVLILVHGFNNTTGDADASYDEQISMLMPALQDSHIAPDAIAKFFWPGDLAVSPLRFAAVDALGYPLDLDQAFKSANRLAVYLRDLLAGGAAGALKISLIGHSLGCRLILEALHALPPPKGGIEIVSLMAAAVPVDLVGTGATLTPRAGEPKRILKFFSERDHVLQAAFPAGQAAAFLAGIEASNGTEAIGRFGNPGSLGDEERTENHHNQYWSDGDVALTFLTAVDPKLRTKLARDNRLVPRELPDVAPADLRSLLFRSLPL